MGGGLKGIDTAQSKRTGAVEKERNKASAEKHKAARQTREARKAQAVQEEYSRTATSNRRVTATSKST